MMPERCFHHQTCLPSLVLQLVPPWSDLPLMGLDQHVQYRQLSKFFCTLAQVVGHNHATQDVIFLPHPTFCLLLSFDSILSFERQATSTRV